MWCLTEVTALASSMKTAAQLSSETRLHSGEGTLGFEMVGDLLINLTFEDFRKAGQDGYTVGQKVFSQPPIVQVLPLKNMREACNFHHRYTSTMTDKMRKKNIQKITL